MLRKKIHSVEKILLPLLILGLHCAERDRNNPLDPENSLTGGRPTGLKVISVRDSVILNWSQVPVDDLTGYRIYRKDSSQSQFDLHAEVPAQEPTYIDSGVQFGVEYEYQITALVSNFESLPSGAVIIEPGPTSNYIGSSGTRELVRLTHDARHNINRVFGFSGILDIESNPATNQIWLIDFFSTLNSSIKRLSPRGVLLGEIPMIGPRDIEINLQSGDVWVVDFHDSSVVKYDAQGQQLFAARGFSAPRAASVDQRNGDCWIADIAANRLVKMSNDGMERSTSGVVFEQLRSISTDSSDGSVWVAEKTRLKKISQNGTLLLQVAHAFSDLQKIVVDPGRNAIWAIDWSPAVVIKFDKAGEMQFTQGGFADPVDLAVNPFDGACLVADTFNNRSVNISSDGEKITATPGVIFPEAVAVAKEP